MPGIGDQSANLLMTVEGTKELKRSLRFLKNDLMRKMAAEALTKVAFDVRDAEADHVKSIFDFASTTTEQFFTSNRGLRVWQARPSQVVLESIVYPASKTESILVEHLRRTQLAKEKHLLLPSGARPKNNPGPSMLAIPLGVKRNKRGKVGSTQTPARLLSKYDKGTKGKKGSANRSGGRSFIADIGGGKEIIVTRKQRRSRKTRGDASYLLIPRASNPPSFKWLEVATIAATANYERQFRRSFKKIVEDYPGYKRFGI